MSHGYFFLCNNETQQECLDRKLLGATLGYKKIIPQINIGDKLFLYNYSTRRLHGVFIAVSEAQENIEPDAWNGRYPWQVKFKIEGESKEISRYDIEKVVRFNGKIPQAVLSEEQVDALIEIFHKVTDVPTPEEEFRKNYPATIRCDDGHFVRSNAEMTIDNWLFRQNIAHGYERRLPVPETVFCDFYILSEEGRDYIYIEYWGMNDELYKKRTERKKEIYNKYNFQLIDLTPRDLDNVDEALPQKFYRYLKTKKFL